MTRANMHNIENKKFITQGLEEKKMRNEPNSDN